MCEVLPKNFLRAIYKEDFALKGYEMVVHPNVEQSKGRGSIMYIKNSLNYIRLEGP